VRLLGDNNVFTVEMFYDSKFNITSHQDKTTKSAELFFRWIKSFFVYRTDKKVVSVTNLLKRLSQCLFLKYSTIHLLQQFFYPTCTYDSYTRACDQEGISAGALCYAGTVVFLA
jgi:hypothetical protein